MPKIVRSLHRTGQRASLHWQAWRSRRWPRDETAVLVVRLDNIGDFVLWLDGARAIRRHYPRPDYRITLAAAQEVAGFAASSGLFDDVIAVDRSQFGASIAHYRAVLRRIAELRAAVAIHPVFSRTEMPDALIRASGATERIGMFGDATNQSQRKRARSARWYTHLVDVPEGLHEIEVNNRFALYFDPAAKPARPRLEAKMIAQPDWLPRNQNYFAVFPGASAPTRQWPAERFAAVIDRIHRQTNWPAVLCGSNADHSRIGDIANIAGSHRVIDACGRTTLAELAGVLQGARLLISNETAAAHIAAAVGCPAVVPMGGGHFERFLPYPAFPDRHPAIVFPVFHMMPCFKCNWHRCIFPRADGDPFACLDRVTTEAVWDAVRPLIAQTGERDAR